MITKKEKSFINYLQNASCGIPPTMPILGGAAGSGRRHEGAVDKIDVSFPISIYTSSNGYTRTERNIPRSISNS